MVPVAIGRATTQVMPVVGTFPGMTDFYQGISVKIPVTR